MNTIVGNTKDDETRTYFIQGEITTEYGHRILKDLVLIKNDSDVNRLKIVVQAYKGDYSCCNAIYDIIREMSFQVECFALGAVQGASTAIFMAGDYRYMAESTKVFFGLSNKSFLNSIEKDTYDRYLEIVGESLGNCKDKIWSLSKRNASLTKVDCYSAGMLTDDSFPI